MMMPSQILLADIAPSTPLFRRHEELITWNEFRRDVACMVAAIQACAVESVVLHTQDNYEFAVGLLACFHSRVRIILPGSLSENTYSRLTAENVIFAQHLNIGSEEAKLESVDPASVWVEFYTSGSSGEPKRINRTFANLEAELDMLESVFPSNEDAPEVFSTVNFYHAYGIIFGLLLPLSRLLVSDVTPFSGVEQTIARVNQKASPHTLAWMVTTPAFIRVWAANVDLFPLLHQPVRILSAGSPLSVADASRVADVYAASVHEIFGSSETGVIAHRCPLNDIAWQPFKEINITQTDGQGLRIYSPAVPPHEYASLGDAVEFLDNGRFHLKPRVDRIVKLADKRISLTEVENCLNASGWVSQSCALIPTTQGVKRLAIAVVPSAQGAELLQKEGYAAYKKQLRLVLARQLESSMMPRRWRIVGELPCNAQGKLQNAKVRALFDTNLQLPIMQPLIKSANELQFRALYVPDSAYFAGHFPGYPIVPGVVILQAVTTIMNRYWSVNTTGIVRLKFSAETLPGACQIIKLTRKSEGDNVSVELILEDSGVKAGQGRFLVEDCGLPAAYSI